MKYQKFSNLSMFLAHLSKREKLILSYSLIFLSFAFLDRVILGTVSSKIKSLNQEIQTRQTEIKTNLKILAQKKRIEIQRANFNSYLEKEKSENEEFTVFLKEIEVLASKSGISLVDIKPGGVKEIPQSKKYLVNLNFEAKMEQVIEFMYNVESANKLLTIEKYQINPKSKDTNLTKVSMVISKLVIP